VLSADPPTSSATPAEPDLEDAYLWAVRSADLETPAVA
jgi:hypothetical protein